MTATGGKIVAKEAGSGDSVTLKPGKVVAKEGGSKDSVTLEPGRIVMREGAGRRIVIDDNNVARRVRCEGGVDVVVIDGNGSNVTLERRCAELSVKGDDNRANVLGSITSIQILGDTNLVTWSAEENARPPRVDNLGSENVVRPSSR